MHINWAWATTRSSPRHPGLPAKLPAPHSRGSRF
jgi:hypothetical protein